MSDFESFATYFPENDADRFIHHVYTCVPPYVGLVPIPGSLDVCPEVRNGASLYSSPLGSRLAYSTKTRVARGAVLNALPQLNAFSARAYDSPEGSSSRSA
jgi:hypothetical protein